MNPSAPLTVDECWALLGDHDVGRVAYTEFALPTIVPVDYTLVGNRVLLQCRSDRMAAHLDGQVVAFQVDDADPSRRGSRSVVVTGTAERLSVADGGDLEARRGAVRLNVGQVRGQHLDDVA